MQINFLPIPKNLDKKTNLFNKKKMEEKCKNKNNIESNNNNKNWKIFSLSTTKNEQNTMLDFLCFLCNFHSWLINHEKWKCFIILYLKIANKIIINVWKVFFIFGRWKIESLGKNEIYVSNKNRGKYLFSVRKPER